MADNLHLIGDWYYRRTRVSVPLLYIGLVGVLIPPIGATILVGLFAFYATTDPGDEESQPDSDLA